MGVKRMGIPTSLRDLISGAESLVEVEDLSGRHGFLQSINPLAKLATISFMIFSSLLISSVSYLAALCTIPLVLALVSKIPIKNFLLRTVWIPVFAVVISLPVLFLTPGQPALIANIGSLALAVTSEGLQRFLAFTIRVWFCVASLSLLILSTGFDKLLKLLSSLRVPAIIVQMFSLTYRYFFVSVHETQRMLLAKEARTYMSRRTINFSTLKDLGLILAALFIRTFERSERVYMAMKSRGFEIENSNRTAIPSLRFRDFIFASSTVAVFGLIVLL
jgi:cobalt/nickel transport system permease protein